MNSYNYLDKIKYRNQCISNIYNNINTNFGTLDWYKQFMPFLPKEVINALDKIIEKENNEKELYNYISNMFNN